MFTLQAPARLHALAFSPDGASLAGVGETGVWVWDVASRALLSGGTTGLPGNMGVFFGADGRLFVMSGPAGLLARSPTGPAWEGNGPLPRVRLAAPMPDGRRAFCQLADPTELGLCALDRALPAWAHPLSQEVTALSCAGDGSHLACVGPDGIVRVLEGSTGYLRHRFFCGSWKVGGLALAPGGVAVACRAESFLHFHRLPPGGESNHHRLNEQHFLSIAWHPSGGFFATTKGDGAADFWDAGDGERRESFDWCLGPLHGLAFDPSGDLAAACAEDGQVVVWDVDR